MAVFLSLFAGAGQQFFTNAGVPLAGGKIFTYGAGGSTPQATYTTSAGNIAHSNPIVLDAAGRVPAGGEIWLTNNLSYKFILQTSANVTVQTLDNISGGVDGASLAAPSGSSLIGFIQAGSGAVARTVQSKLRDTVSVKDFGAVGDGVADDTAAIQAAVNAAVAGGFKQIVFPDGNYVINSTITVPAYYSPSIAQQLWGSVGKDFYLDFGTATITTSIASGSTLFSIPVDDFPETRYFFTANGGVFFPNNANVDIFTVSGNVFGVMFNFIGQSVPPGRNVNSLVKLFNTSLTYEPAQFVIKDAVVSGESVFTFDGTAGGLTFADNFTIDNISHTGTDAGAGTIRFIGGTGLTASRISKIVQVGVGKIVSGGGSGGYMTYSSLTDLYSESTTTGAWLIDCALERCDISMGRLYINDHTTQTLGWYIGLSNGSNFNELHVNSGTSGGGVWYNTAANNQYPIIQFAANSAGNQVSGYTQNEYKNVVNGRSGAVLQVDNVSPRAVLTSYDYTGTTISTTGFTQCGSTVPKVSFLGTKYVIDIELSGVAFGVDPKVLAVECRIGSATVRIGADISITAGQWKAQGRLLFNNTSGTTYDVILSFGESWSSNTVGTNKVGTVDITPVTVGAADVISFGLNAKTLPGAGVTIGDGTMELLPRFAIYDALA